MRRRDAIKPRLNKDYSSLCASHVAVTTYLFGDNLYTQLNDNELQTKLARQQGLKGLKNLDHKDALELEATTTPVLMENRDGVIFYPTAGSGNNTPQVFKPRRTRP